MSVVANNSMISRFIAMFIVVCFGLSAFAIPVAAAEPKSSSFEVSEYLKIDEGQTYLETEEKKKGALASFIIKLIKLLTTVIGSFALLFVIIGGLTLMMSHGSSTMQQKGKQMILYSAIGLIVAFTSLIVVTFVQSLFYTS